MKLKLDANGNAVLQDGHPVYIHEDGVERPFDAAATAAAIKARNAEAKAHRERAEAAEAKVKAFEGLDPEAARKALETVSNLDNKKLIDAGEVERVKESITKGFNEKLTAAEKRAQEAEDRYAGEKVATAFLGSKFLTEKTVLPADVAQAYFSKRVKVDPTTGRVRVLDSDGNPLLSKANPGAEPTFDEAMEILVTSHPQRDSILRGTNGSGSGAPSGGGQGSGAKSLTRAQFEQLDPQGRVSAMKEGVRVTD